MGIQASRVRGQAHGTGAAAVAQGVGDEFGDDQDHRVGGLGCEPWYETSRNCLVLSRAPATDVAEQQV